MTHDPCLETCVIAKIPNALFQVDVKPPNLTHQRKNSATAKQPKHLPECGVESFTDTFI